LFVAGFIVVCISDGKWRKHIDVLSVMEQRLVGIEGLEKLHARKMKHQ
jgi:hypothetical protein